MGACVCPSQASFLLEEAAGSGRPLKPVLLLLEREREGEEAGEGGRLEGKERDADGKSEAAVTGAHEPSVGAGNGAGDPHRIGPESPGVTADGMRRGEVAEHRRVAEAVLRSLPSRAVERGVASRAKLAARLDGMVPTLRQLALLPEGEQASEAGMVTFAVTRLAASLKVRSGTRIRMNE